MSLLWADAIHRRISWLGDDWQKTLFCCMDVCSSMSDRLCLNNSHHHEPYTNQWNHCLLSCYIATCPKGVIFLKQESGIKLQMCGFLRSESLKWWNNHVLCLVSLPCKLKMCERCNVTHASWHRQTLAVSLFVAFVPVFFSSISLHEREGNTQSTGWTWKGSITLDFIILICIMVGCRSQMEAITVHCTMGTVLWIQP